MSGNDDDLANIITTSGSTYDPSMVALIGCYVSPISDRRSAEIKVRSELASIVRTMAIPKTTQTAEGKTIDTSNPTIALIYAYAYEGHTYRLAKPQIMLVEGEGEVYPPGKTDGRNQPDGGLFLWRQSKDDETISIEVQSGTVERLVIDANLPGNRSVTAYGSKMQMAHRGGRLTGGS